MNSRKLAHRGLALLIAVAVLSILGVNSAEAGLRNAALGSGCCAPQPCCQPCCKMVTIKVEFRDPCTCCKRCVELCVPECCAKECPSVFSRGTLIGAGLVRYTWCRGYSATIRLQRCGSYRVIYRG
jgi:hypothetical protein